MDRVGPRRGRCNVKNLALMNRAMPLLGVDGLMLSRMPTCRSYTSLPCARWYRLLLPHVEKADEERTVSN